MTLERRHDLVRTVARMRVRRVFGGISSSEQRPKTASGSCFCLFIPVFAFAFPIDTSENGAAEHEDLLPGGDVHSPPPDFAQKGEHFQEPLQNLVRDGREFIAAKDGREREEDVGYGRRSKDLAR